MAINRLNYGAAARAATHASAPVAPASPATEHDPQAHDPPGHRHGHPLHEHQGGPHGHPHPAGHGPTPRPRRSSSKSPARRRSRSHGLSGDDEDIEFGDDEEGDGIAPAGASGHGGDASDDGGAGSGGGSHDRQKRDDDSGGGDPGGRRPGGAAADASTSVRRVQGLVTGAQQRLAADRHKAASCRLVAGWEPGAAVCAALHADRLAAMRACGDVARMEPKTAAREYDRMAEYLVAARGSSAGDSRMFNLMLPMWLLSLSTPRTKSRRDHAMSVLEVRARACRGTEK